MKWRWSNIPIPEAYLIGLLFGSILHYIFRFGLIQLPFVGYMIGLPLFLIGIGLSVWSVIVTKEIKIASPTKLLVSGPYAISRNPMYVAWTFIYVGISFTLNSFWIIVFLPAIIIYIHFVEIRREEEYLFEKFGRDYVQYQKNVRRYF